MDTTGFFAYPTLPATDQAPTDPAEAAATADAGAAPAELLPGLREADWGALLAAAETLRFAPGDRVIRAGDDDRTLYLLLDGRLVAGATTVAAPALAGEVGFLDGRPRAVDVLAVGHAEVARLSWDAFAALAARDPRLGRAVLVGLAGALAARLRAAGAALPGWTG